MDFSYFTSAPQPYQYYDMHPAPGHAQPNPLDEFKTGPSDDQYDAAFAAFQQSFQYDPATFLAQPHPPAPQSPHTHTHTHTHTTLPPESLMSLSEVDMANAGNVAPDVILDEPTLVRSSSEEKDTMTPQQSRRKAQNRAAQRAFRERKEKHVKDLEARLSNLQQQSMTLNGENEHLRRELARIATENEILRATNGAASNGPTPFLEEPDELIGPLGYVPTDLPAKSRSLGGPSTGGAGSASKYSQFGTLKAITVDDDTGQQLLGASATWDYIQAHELSVKGLVDVGDVCERLKGMARCDGHGPIFLESDIRKAIEESAVAGGRDELI